MQTQQSEVRLAQYVAQTREFAPLEREEEIALARAWRDHQDPDAADRLVRAHLRYVVATAAKYRRYGVPMNELIAEGNFGLVHALRKFEPERGFRFVTYAAYWIRAYVLNHVIRSWSLVGSGSGALRSKMFFKLRRERVRLANLLGDREQAEEALAEQMKVSRTQLDNMLRRLESRDVSLDSKVFDDSSGTLVDTLVSPSEHQDQTMSTTETQRHLRTVVDGALKQLDSRERYIVESRLIADAEDRMSLADIGRALGVSVSRERARQLESRAKSKLKNQLMTMPDAAKPEWLTDRMLTQSAA
jgi:RNA polymerase sigma-32 factor